MSVFDNYQNLSGLEFLKGLANKGDRSPMAELFGMQIISVEPGHATLEALPTEKFYNPMQRVHGGFAATVLDSVLGCAVMSKLDAGVGYGTVNLSINYVRKIDVETGVLTATGTVLHTGRTMFTAEAKLVDKAGKLYAHANGTFLLYPKQS
jgi:acyl-CoA thioesterase